MDKFREIFARRLRESEFQTSYNLILDIFDQAKTEYWAKQREEIRRKFRPAGKSQV
jgi:hypothetical protein